MSDAVATGPQAAAYERALALWREGDREAAYEALRLVAAEHAELLNDLGVMAAELSDGRDGRALLEAALAIDPDHAEARANRDELAREAAEWRRQPGLGGPDPELPERAFPGMPAAGVMREHALRYAFTLDLVAGLRVLDLGCGTGYGSEMLTWSARSVEGFDLWRPAAAETPRWPGAPLLRYGHDLCADDLPDADAAVAFEVIEHLEDAPAAMRSMWRSVHLVVASFPNPVFHGSHHNPYHVNDWDLDTFERELTQAAAGRFPAVSLSHFHQDYRDGTNGAVLPGRDPDSSYWIVVAAGTERT